MDASPESQTILIQQFGPQTISEGAGFRSAKFGHDTKIGSGL